MGDGALETFFDHSNIFRGRCNGRVSGGHERSLLGHLPHQLLDFCQQLILFVVGAIERFGILPGFGRNFVIDLIEANDKDCLLGSPAFFLGGDAYFTCNGIIAIS